MRRPLLFLIVGIALWSVGIHYARYYILGQAPVLSLSASTLSDTVSQSLSNSYSGTAPVIGEDFSIQSIHYLNNNNWAVVLIKPLHASGDTAVVVLNKRAGNYKTVIGPSSDVQATTASSLPAPVAYYLYSQGYVNTAPVEQP